MPQSFPLFDSIQQAMSRRAAQGMTMFSLDHPLPSYAPDFFSNDYLSLSTDPSVRNAFLRRVLAAPPNRLLGSTGSRLGTGNSLELNTLEKSFVQFFHAPSALFFFSGFTANLAFLATVPQKNDVIIYDELIHVSCREGIRLSTCTSYRFPHNSVISFRNCLGKVLQKHPQITDGTATVFILVESLYSMDGDFCPLTEIVETVESLVPAGNAHIVVDEAHTSGICGPNGTGYIAHLGLNDRVHTTVHTFGKAWGFHGAVVLTAPIIRTYMINFAKNFMFSTSVPYTDIYALESCLGVISNARGQELRESLNLLSRYARNQLSVAFRDVPEALLTLDTSGTAFTVVDDTLCSPIISIFTPRAAELADFLLKRGYAVTAMTFPVVKRPRIRLSFHVGNKVEEIDVLIHEILAWVEQQRTPACEPHAEVRVKL